MHLPVKRRALAAILAAVTAIGTATVIASTPAVAATCQVSYRADQWSGGFVGYVKLTAGDSALHGWTIVWTWPGDQKITSFWNSTVAQNGAVVTAVNLGYNGERRSREV